MNTRYDPKCEALAIHFLDGYAWDSDHMRALAGRIQDAVEAYLFSDEAPPDEGEGEVYDAKAEHGLTVRDVL